MQKTVATLLVRGPGALDIESVIATARTSDAVLNIYEGANDTCAHTVPTASN